MEGETQGIDPAQQAQQELEKELATPLTQEEAQQAFADLDVRRLQLTVVRQKWLTEIAQLQLRISDLDTQLYALDMSKAVIFRRTLNKTDK